MGPIQPYMQTLAIASHNHQVVANHCHPAAPFQGRLTASCECKWDLVFFFVASKCQWKLTTQRSRVWNQQEICQGGSPKTNVLKANPKNLRTGCTRSMWHQVFQFPISKWSVILVTQERIGRELRLQKVVICSGSMWPTARGASNLCSKHSQQCSAKFPPSRL